MTPTTETREVHRHRAILDAALELVAEAGYDRMTMDAVAGRAKASKATIYRHWPGKAQLVADAMQCHAEPEELPDTGTLRDDLHAFVCHGCAAMSGTDGALVVELLSASMRDPELGEVMRSCMIATKTAALGQILDRARERGEVTAGADPTVVIDVLPGVMFFHLLVQGQAPTEAFADHVVDDILLPLVTASR